MVAQRWPSRLQAIAFGGDYNPEQWPEEVWAEDVRLMRKAGVNLVTVGVFSWAKLEPAPGRYQFGWLDRLLDRLHDASILVDLATPTAAPPAWFFRLHPEALPVTWDGHVLGTGARESFCPSSLPYREAATAIAEQLARRYGEHPALALWHSNNEYGAHVGQCYCDRSAAAFRTWLRDRYGDLEGLNEAWGTSFWGQSYGDWAEVMPPRRAPMPVNPAQQLDFLRFSSDEYLACFIAEREVLHTLTPGIPVTTNFMTTNCRHIDYWRWAREVDVISNDHYLQAEAPNNHVELAMAADLTRSLAGGLPWLLMEHSTGAVSWQPRNLAKRPGEMRRNSFSHLARGADAIMFFQWRASRVGAEKFHSAMLPQGGTATRGWREVTALGRDLASLTELRGSRVQADVAVAWDWQAWWALELEFRPSCEITYRERVRAFYEALWNAHRTVDFVHPEADLTTYPVVVVPSLYLMTVEAAANLRRYVEQGGHLLVSFFSGIVDEHDAVHPGPYPGALGDLLGLSVEEFHPLRESETITLDGGLPADAWSEAVVLNGAEAVLRFKDGPDAGEPALTRHTPASGRGSAWYLATRLDAPSLSPVLDMVLAGAGRAPTPIGALPADLEIVRRVSQADSHSDGERPPRAASYLFLINHGDTDVTVPTHGHELLHGTTAPHQLRIPAGAIAVIREDP